MSDTEPVPATTSITTTGSGMGRLLWRGRVPLGWGVASLVVLWLWCVVLGPGLVAAQAAGWIDPATAESLRVPRMLLWLTVALGSALVVPLSVLAFLLWLMLQDLSRQHRPHPHFRMWLPDSATALTV